MTAGLEHARGDVVAILDADLQDPPEELPRFFQKCREGYDVVYGIRTKRKEGYAKRFTYWLYYRLLASLSNIDIPLDSGDFCVLSRRALNALNALPERSRFIRGLRAWLGFRQAGVAYERHARSAGQPKYTFRKLLNLGMDGIINFSSRPLRRIMYLGMWLGFLSLLVGATVIIQYFTQWKIFGYNPRDQLGWTSLILAILFLSSIQLFCLGIIGEYIGRIFEEIKRRPVYVVKRSVNLTSRVSSEAEA